MFGCLAVVKHDVPAQTWPSEVSMREQVPHGKGSQQGPGKGFPTGARYLEGQGDVVSRLTMGILCTVYLPSPLHPPSILQPYYLDGMISPA